VENVWFLKYKGNCSLIEIGNFTIRQFFDGIKMIDKFLRLENSISKEEKKIGTAQDLSQFLKQLNKGN
jgi:hypothetical protein